MRVLTKRGQWVSGSTRDAWKQHVRGLAALIELCGPGAFRHANMRQAFEQARAHIVSKTTLILTSSLFD